MFRPVLEMFQDMTLWKFKVEGIFGENILGHPLDGNFEFKQYSINRLWHEM